MARLLNSKSSEFFSFFVPGSFFFRVPWPYGIVDRIAVFVFIKINFWAGNKYPQIRNLKKRRTHKYRRTSPWSYSSLCTNHTKTLRFLYLRRPRGFFIGLPYHVHHFHMSFFFQFGVRDLELLQPATQEKTSIHIIMNRCTPHGKHQLQIKKKRPAARVLAIDHSS